MWMWMWMKQKDTATAEQLIMSNKSERVPFKMVEWIEEGIRNRNEEVML